MKRVVIVAACAAALLAALLLLKMPGHSFRGPAPPPGSGGLPDALRRDVEHLAATIGERNVILSTPYAAAADYIEHSLREAGYATARQTYVVEGVTCANVEAERRGSGDGIVVIGAHYDSVDGSPGADDNASGVAALLALARALARAEPRQTIRFVAFANEEPPYFMSEAMGSYVYAKRCRARGERITAMLSLESLGYFRDEPHSQQYPALLSPFYPDQGNFIAFASNLGSRALLTRALGVFRKHASVPSEGAAMPEIVPGIAWSDQWSFWQFGYPAVMVTDTAPYRNPHYHTARDLPDTLDYTRLARVVEGLQAVITELASG